MTDLLSDQSAPPTLPELLIVSARGSTEPQSGSRLLMPLARSIIRQYPGDARYIELAYPASFKTFSTQGPLSLDLGHSPHIGVQNLIGLLREEAGRSRDQHFVLLGWSQGAQVITDALLNPEQRIAGQDAGLLGSDVTDRIVAIALFGNPAFTAGEPHNAGDFQPEVSGVHPREPGALEAYSDRLRDYCAANDIAAQAVPTATIDGHTAYFHNHLPAKAQQFVLDRIQELTSVQQRQAG